MIYDFRCPGCGHMSEEVRFVSERDNETLCPHCGKRMERVPSFKGALKTEHPVWLDKHALGSLQPPDERPIETRTEHDAYCKEHGIIQL